MLKSDYHYDELEGFTDLPKEKIRCRRDQVRMTVSNRCANLSAAAKAILGDDTKAVLIKVNPDRKQVLVCRADEDPHAFLLGKGGKRSSYRGRINCSQLVKAVEKMTNRSLDVVTISVPGSAARSKRNAIIFDLANFDVVQPTKRKEK